MRNSEQILAGRIKTHCNKTTNMEIRFLNH